MLGDTAVAVHPENEKLKHLIGRNVVLPLVGRLIPIVGDVVRAGAGVVGLLFTAVIAPAIIAVAWLWYRPLVAIGVVLVGALFAALAIWVARLHKADHPVTPRA